MFITRCVASVLKRNDDKNNLVRVLILIMFLILSTQTQYPRFFCPNNPSIDVYKADELIISDVGRTALSSEVFVIINAVDYGGSVYYMTQEQDEFVLSSDVHPCFPLLVNNYQTHLTVDEFVVLCDLKSDTSNDYDYQRAAYYLPFINEALEEQEITDFMGVLYFIQTCCWNSDVLNIWESKLTGSGSFSNPRCPSFDVDELEAFKPRGPLGMFGMCDYKNCGENIKINLFESPELVSHPEYGFRASLWLFKHILEFDKLSQSNDDVEDSGQIVSYGLNEISWFFKNVDDGSWNVRASRVMTVAAMRLLHPSFSITPPGGGNNAGCQSPFGCGNSTVPL